MKDLFEMTSDELKLHLFKIHPKVLLCSIPDNISDNDPLLTEKIQTIYDTNLKDFKFQFSGTDISCIENEYIKEQVYKLTEFDSMLHSRKDRIKVTRYLKFLEDQKRRISKPAKTIKKLTFEDLFFEQETAGKIDRIFEENGYTKDGQWIDSGKKKRIATAFYVLKDEYPEINVIRSGNPTSQLRVFCKHFGIITTENTLRNLLERPKYEHTEKPDYIEFMNLFNELK